MKISTFFKGVFISSLVAGSVASAVVFSNINIVKTPYVKVLTKEKYLELRKEQNISLDNKFDPVIINYSSLPSSDISFKDLVMQKNLRTNAFVLTVGSQAFAQTNKFLTGQSKPWVSINPYNVDNSAIMLQLYDLFYNENSEHHNAVKDFNINFYSYIDILDTKEIKDASNLLQYRRTQLGEKPKENNNNNGVSVGQSNVWTIDVPDTEVDKEELVVKSSSDGEVEFNYNPELGSHYLFRPDDKYETEYEKVYFRDQKEIGLFLNTLKWTNQYASAYLNGFNIDETGNGSIVCAKIDPETNVWKFKTFTGTEKLNDFIAFYNPKYEEGNQENTNNPSQGDENPQRISLSTFTNKLNSVNNSFLPINKKEK